MAVATAPKETDCAAVALSAYEALAPAYDEMTADYGYDRWLSALERLALDHGLAGKRVLDVACGTGKSFLPLLGRGYDVSACDLSPGMVEIARSHLPDPARAFVADMRALPSIGPFDLVTCLDDAVNYLLEPSDLEAALRSMRSVLRPGGVLVFDVNTLHTYRTTFGADAVWERDQRLFCWRGMTAADAEPAAVHEAVVEVFTRDGPGRCWIRTTVRHRQRHHPRAAVERALTRAGLTPRAVRGQSPGARLSRDADEQRHTKFVFVAQRPKGGPMVVKP
ncbi:MAG TPA: class I SAM-dependent methyltransferase [Thermoleophilaceae bacterium]|nr:class I SAM-dependent methyltransferase [Thermoleophilaceae bacterium]